jgi:hypothetical protein
MTPQLLWPALLAQLRGQAVKWLVLGSVLTAKSWTPFIRLALLLVLFALVQLPLDIWLAK